MPPAAAGASVSQPQNPRETPRIREPDMIWDAVCTRMASWARVPKRMSASPPKVWSLAAAAAALLGTGTLCQAQPEVFYYQGLTEQENADVIAWSVLYWQRADQGGGSPGTGFEFTTPIMNSHLFNPVRSARPTLELVGSIPEGYCDRMYEVGVPDDESGARAALRELMLFGEITTDPDDDPWGNWEHLMLILATPPDVCVTLIAANGDLTSINLPLEEINAEAGEAALKLDLSPESQEVIGSLIIAGGFWASVGQSGNVPQWQSLITGETSKAETFRAKVDAYLVLAEVEVASTQVIQANFGLFGELPIVGVRLSDCYLLMDPTNGNLSGPFEVDSPLDARGLLSFHSDAYEAGKAVRYYGSDGCAAPGLAVWIPWGMYPGTPAPRLPAPALPSFPLIPPWGAPAIFPNPTLTGWDTAPVCSGPTVPATPYSCTVYRQYLDATGRLVWVREVYGCPAAATTPPAGCFTGAPTRHVWW